MMRSSRMDRQRRTRLQKKRLLLETLESRSLLATFTVASLGDSGQGTLRQAIEDANHNDGADVIRFTIAGSIKPQTELPIVIGPTTIDGTTAPDYAGKPRVEIDGSQAGAASGLFLQGGDSVVKGLAINNFSGLGGLVLASSNNTVTANFLGVNLAGTAAKANLRGIVLTPAVNHDDVAGNTIGGTTAATRNIISGNSSDGILIAGAYDTVVIGNYIGVDFSGTAAIPNGGNGVAIMRPSPLVNSAVPTEAGTGNIIGRVTAGHGNRIRNNGGDGVSVLDGNENAIRGNSIGSSGGLGIDLAESGVTLNDELDLDSGANFRQNFPIVGGMSATSTSLIVSGALFSRPNTTYSVDVYVSGAPGDASGYGEGLTYLKSVTTTTDDKGIGSWFINHGSPIASGSMITATATDPSGNTSEFSKKAAVPPVGSAATVKFLSAAPRYRENVGVARLLVTRNGNLSGTTKVNYQSTTDSAVAGSDFSSRSGTLTFSPNQSVKVIEIPLVNDAIFEGVERFDVTLSQVVGGQLSGTNPAEVVIDDDDLFDARFSGDGRISYGTTGVFPDQAEQIIVLPDGKMLVAGTGGIEDGPRRFQIAKFHADGSLDKSFGIGGLASVQVSLEANPEDILHGFTVQSDGKIVLVGETGKTTSTRIDTGIVRLNANGTLDTSFGTGGRLQLDFGTSFREAATATVQLASGKLMVAGYASDDGYYLARLNTNGTLDTSFQSEGFVVADPGPGEDVPVELLVQSDGKFVLAGVSGDTGSQTGDFSAARFNADGTLDTSFGGGDGLVALADGYTVGAAALDSQGRLVMAGSYLDASVEKARIVRLTAAGILDTAFSGDGQVDPAGLTKLRGVQAAGDALFVLGNSSTGMKVQRFNANGTADNNFSGDSIAPISFAATAQAADLVRDAAGKLVIAATVEPNSGDFGIARLNTGGGADGTFSSDGRHSITFNGPQADNVADVLLQPDGKVISVGSFVNTAGQASQIKLVRHLLNGQLDTTFGSGGTVLLPQSNGTRSFAATLQGNGKILIASSVGSAIAVWRLNDNGALDDSFSSDGVGTLGGTGLFVYTSGVAVQADGKIVVAAGATDGSTNGDLLLGRFTSSGAADSSFDSDGLLNTGLEAYVDSARLAINASGKYIVAATRFDETQEKYLAQVARLLPSGALDTTFSGDGKADVDLGQDISSEVRAIAVYPNGNIAVGMRAQEGSNVDAALARLLFNGPLDTSFDGDGKFRGPLGTVAGPSEVFDLAVDGSNRLLVTGSAFDFVEFRGHFVVQRRLNSGALDASFDSDGILDVLPNSSGDAEGQAIALSSNAVVVAGVSDGDVVLARLLSAADAGPFAFVQLSAATYSVNEGSGTITITVQRSGDTTLAASVGWSIESLAAIVGQDLPAASGTVTFAAGQTSKTFSVNITNDTRDEANEDFRVSLNNATGLTQIGSRQNAKVTIVDNDPTPTLSVNNVSIVEGNSGTKDLVFTVTLSAASNRTVSVVYHTTADTAKASTNDFVAKGNTTLTFAAGQTTKQVTVKIIGDTVAEDSERFFLDLHSPTNATIVKARGIGTISDNDPLSVSAAGSDAFFDGLGEE